MGAGILPLIELIVNIGLTIAGSTGVIPANSGALAASLEAAAGPLISSLSTGQPTSSDVMAAFATCIGILATLKSQTGLDPKILARVNQYMAAAEDGVSGYMLASKAYDPANYAPVPPAA